MTGPADKLNRDELLDELALLFARAAVEQLLLAQRSPIGSAPNPIEEDAA